MLSIAKFTFGRLAMTAIEGYELLSSTQSCNASVCVTVRASAALGFVNRLSTTWRGQVRVTNSGAVAGSEVIQFYLVPLGEMKFWEGARLA